MAKYIIIRNFTASEFQFELPSPNPRTKAFKKGDIVDAEEQQDFGLNKHLVTTDGFGIDGNALPYSGTHNSFPIGEYNPRTKKGELPIFGIIIAFLVFAIVWKIIK